MNELNEQDTPLKICYTIFHIDNQENHYRKKNIQLLHQALSERFHYLETTTYKISNKTELKAFQKTKGKFKVKARLKFGEIGCFASNYYAWQQFLESPFDVLIVIEDDALPEADLESKIGARLNEAPRDFDVVSLYVHPGKQFKYDAEVHDFGNETISKIYQNQSTLAYAISKKGARKFIDLVNQRIDNPFDLFLYDTTKVANVYALKPEFDLLFSTTTLDDEGEVIREFTNIQHTEFTYTPCRMKIRQTVGRIIYPNGK
ncbi:MAG: glycosyltransferase family 25 protein [Candidatus Nanopelagicales bacterium]